MYGGYQYRSFCYVEDAANMTINLMDNKTAINKVINIGSDNYTKISKLAEYLFNILMN